MAIDNEALLEAIDFHKETAYGTDETSFLGQKRADSIKAYLGLNTNPAPEGRSQVVDRSVYETIQVILPSLVRIFAGSSDEVCKAIPIGPDDEAGAEQTTAILRHFVTEKNNWEQIVNDWVMDCALSPNGYAMAYWDESERLIREVYEGQSDEQLAFLMQDSNVNILQHSQTIDKEATQQLVEQYQQATAQWQQMAQMAAMQGQPPPEPPPQPEPVYLHDLVIERKENEGKVCIRVLAPEHCEVSSDTPSWTLEDCPYFKYSEQKSIADLRAMGLDVPDDISDDDNKNTPEEQARDRFGELRDSTTKGASRLVWTDMVWVKADAENDGEVRLYYVLKVGRDILYAEPVPRIPVASMTANPMPHRHPGLSIAETVLDLQETKTAIKRGGLDNLYLANNGRHVISSRVNVDDLLESRPGGVVRMLDDSLPAEGHVLPLVHPFAFDSIIGSLEYFDQERQNRSGASRYFSGTDAGAINKTAAGTMALQNMASMRVEHIARIMAPAVESLFSAVWEIISKHANKPLTVKIKGTWTPVDPQAWRTKRDIKISVGVGAGNKESMMAQMQQILMAQMQLMPAGIAGPQQFYESVMEMGKLAGFANPAKFWINPATQPPKPASPPPEVILEQMKQQFEGQQAERDRMFEAQKIQLQEQNKAEIAKMQDQTEKMLAAFDGWLKMQDQTIQHEFEKQKLAHDSVSKELDRVHQTATMAASEASKASMKTESDGAKKSLDDMAKVFTEKMEGLAKQMQGSRVVGIQKVKDQNGRTVGAKRMLADGTTEEIPIN